LWKTPGFQDYSAVDFPLEKLSTRRHNANFRWILFSENGGFWFLFHWRDDEDHDRLQMESSSIFRTSQFYWSLSHLIQSSFEKKKKKKKIDIYLGCTKGNANCHWCPFLPPSHAIRHRNAILCPNGSKSGGKISFIQIRWTPLPRGISKDRDNVFQKRPTM
jgi:hypothetical protein